MPTALEYVETVASQVNETLAKIEHDTLSAVRSWTATVESALPETVTSVDALQSLPRPDAVVELAFDVGRKVVELQSDVARQLATALDPTLQRLGVTAATPAPAPATTATPARTTTARTSTSRASNGSASKASNGSASKARKTAS